MAGTPSSPPHADPPWASVCIHDARSNPLSTPQTHGNYHVQRDVDANGDQWPGVESKGQSIHARPDRDLGTRNLCILGLIIGWCAGIASTAIGIYIVASGPIEVPSFLLNRAAIVGTLAFSWTKMPDPKLPNPYLADHRVFDMQEATMILIPLLLHITITLVLDCINSIHSTTLRWALWHEGRLRHNCNLRLFRSARRGGANRWPANVASGVGLALTYGGTTVMTFCVYIVGSVEVKDNRLVTDENFSGSRTAIDFNGWGLLGLGVGLLLQSVVATCSLFPNDLVGTWNSNPLATARACKYLYEAAGGQGAQGRDAFMPSRPAASPSGKVTTMQVQHTVHFRPYRIQERTQSEYLAFHLPFTNAESTICSQPEFTQPSMSASSMLPETRKIVRLLWVAFAAFGIWATVVGIVAYKKGTTTSEWVRDQTGRSDFLSYWQAYGQIQVFYTTNPYTHRREWIGLLIQCAVLSLLLANLHLAELLVKLSRDEAIWRKAATLGTKPASWMLVEDARSWPCWAMFVYKFMVPWIFGYAFSCSGAVFMNVLPFVTQAALLLVLALFAEYLIRVRPKGSQPATYGDIRALLALVDDWDHERIFWGDKREYIEGIRVAGTAGNRLADLKANCMYLGLSHEQVDGRML